MLRALLLLLLLSACAHIKTGRFETLPCNARQLLQAAHDDQKSIAKLQRQIKSIKPRDDLQAGCQAFVQARLAQMSGHDAESYALMAKAKELIPDLARADLALDLAKTHHRREKLRIDAIAPDASNAEVRNYFERLTKRGLYDRIVAEWPERKRSDVSIARHYVEALAYLKRYADARREAEAVQKENDNYEAHMLLGWTLAKGDWHDAAAGAYMQAKAKGHGEEIEKACLFAGFAQFEHGSFTEAKKAWLSCDPMRSRSEYNERMTWLLALSAILSRNDAEALPFLSHLADSYRGGSEHTKYRYWLMKAHATLGNADAAQKLHKEINDEDPLGFYALLMRSENNQAITTPRFAADALRTTAIDGDGAANVAKLFYALGLDKNAENEALRSSVGPMPKLALLQSVGAYHEAWRRAYRVAAPSVQNNALKCDVSIRATYAQPEADVAERVRRRGVPSSMLYAIMQQESGFNENAISEKGAVGIMQLLPKDAARYAQVLGVHFNDADLLDPRRAIPLGAQALREHHQRFGKWWLAAAAYNAGEQVVASWMQEFGELNWPLLLERIPYKETRNYVKTILVKRAIYDGLVSGKIMLRVD